MRVHVELSQDVDAASWAARNAAGTAADASPYGLHHLERFGHAVRFARPVRSPLARRVGESVAGRTWGLQSVHSVLGAAQRTRRTADVVLCMDERNGIPAALMPSWAPVVSGVAWLEDLAELSGAHARIASLALSRMAGVFTECRAMLGPLESTVGVPGDRLHFVTLGIDEVHFMPADTPPVADRVFTVGDDRMRDYGTLVAALKRVREHRPQLTAEVATTLPVELPQEWSIIHRRRMDHAVRGCYRNASVVALALEHTRQGSGLTVILEAMASGRPLVVTDNPGLSDYVEDGVTGLLVPQGSPAAMADAVEAVLADPARAAAMGRAARARVEERFTSKHMAQDLDRVLRHALGRTPGPETSVLTR